MAAKSGNKARAGVVYGITEWLLRLGANGCPHAACKARYAPAATLVLTFVKRYKGLLAFPGLGAKEIALPGLTVDTSSKAWRTKPESLAPDASTSSPEGTHEPGELQTNFASSGGGRSGTQYMGVADGTTVTLVVPPPA